MTDLSFAPEHHLAAAHDAPLQSLAFAKGRDLYATGDTNRVVKVWENGKLIYQLPLTSRHDKIRPTERIRGLVFSPSGDQLYTACGDKVMAWDMASGQCVWSYRPPRSFGFLIVSPCALAVSPEGELAVATDAGRISVWTPEGALRAHWYDNDSPRHLSFASDDKLIGTDSFTFCSWKAALGRKLGTNKLKERAYGFASTPTGSRICLRSIHGLDVLDGESGERIAHFPVDYGLPLISISDDGRFVALGGLTEVRVHDLETGATRLYTTGSAVLKSLKFKSPGELAAGCSDGTLRFWNVDAAPVAA